MTLRLSLAGALLLLCGACVAPRLASHITPAAVAAADTADTTDTAEPAPADIIKVTPPAPAREFRAAWVATVANIDWPSKRGEPVAQQKREIIAILDKAKQLNLNAIVLQVRPACDALYPSKLEPWSEYLTGRMGQAPSPFYDPLAMWVHEAHARGLELHAWFNPYRAHHPTAHGPISADHVSKRHPEIVRVYGSHLWLDPGAKETQDYSIGVVMDVVKRYDIDGVHMDDYFYPYKEKDAAGNVIEFPDDSTYQAYVGAGGKLDRDDWRRSNVDHFVERLYHSIKETKPWVKLGVSPFGIWRPGNPAQIQGFDAYAQLYADSRKWLNEGWVDYWTPQLYWPIAQTAQSYPVLLRWWAEQNTHHRNLWPGNYTSRVGEGARGWQPAELINQIAATRAQPGATGNVHFSMVTLMRDSAGLDEALLRGPYAQPALVPASPWLDHGKPGTPRANVKRADGALAVRLKGAGGKAPWQWLIQTRGTGGVWRTTIAPGSESAVRVPANGVRAVAVSAVDRCGVTSEPLGLAVR